MTDRTILIDGQNSLHGLRLSPTVQSYPTDGCWMHVRYRDAEKTYGTTERVLSVAVVDLYGSEHPTKVGVRQQLKWLNAMLDSNFQQLLVYIREYIRSIDDVGRPEIYNVKVFSAVPCEPRGVARMFTLDSEGTWSSNSHPNM